MILGIFLDEIVFPRLGPLRQYNVWVGTFLMRSHEILWQLSIPGVIDHYEHLWTAWSLCGTFQCLNDRLAFF